MFPVLFQIGSITIYSYGFFIAIGYLACLSVSTHLAKKENIPPTKIADLGFYLLLSGFIGARILFVITKLDYFLENPIEILYVWQGGLVFFGGLIVATAVCFYYTKKNKMPIMKVVDIAAIAVPIAHAFGRIGCFSAGCCHGSACDLPWAVRISSVHVQENLRNVPIHPTQLYESFLLFTLAFFLYWKWHRKAFNGQILLLYLMCYSVIRSFTEIFRGDLIRGFVIGEWISTSQFISIIIFLIAAGLYFKLRKKS